MDTGGTFLLSSSTMFAGCIMMRSCMDLWLFKINNCNVKILTRRKLGFRVVQYQLTTEQLLISGCEPQFILHTPP